MPVLRDNRVVDDPWVALEDAADAAPASDAPLIVPLQRWRHERAALSGRNGPLGLRLAPDQSPAQVADDLDRFRLIAIEFPTFRDGRGYSHARQLRRRFGYRGEIRAVGSLLPDQAAFLRRCGVDSIELPPGADAGRWSGVDAEYDDVYQAAAAPERTIPHKRAAARRAAALDAEHGALEAEALMRVAITDAFRGRIAVVSAFGAESAVLLDLVARIDAATPVIFLDTGKHFPQTLAYRDRLIARFGLSDARSVAPAAEAARHDDPHGDLWRRAPDACCALRKVAPLERALRGFDAWITGRKRFQTAARAGLSAFEAVDGRVKVNPLARWRRAQVEAAFDALDLPRHPLVAAGYPSIGCAPCTKRVAEGDNIRSGRWVHADKTECGIHGAGNGAKRITS